MTRQYVECSVAQLVLSASSSNSCNSFVYSYIGINALIECIILYGVGHWDLFIHSSIVHLVTTSMADLAEWLSIIVFRFWTGINTNIGGAGGGWCLVVRGTGTLAAGVVKMGNIMPTLLISVLETIIYFNH